MKRSFRLTTIGDDTYTDASLVGGGCYNSAAIKGGAYNTAAIKGGAYNTAAITGGDCCNSAAISGGREYNQAAIDGGRKFYNNAAVHGGRCYNNAAIKGGRRPYNNAAISGGKNMSYTDAAVLGGKAFPYTDMALAGGSTIYTDAALAGGSIPPSQIMLGEHPCDCTYNKAALKGGEYVERGQRGDYGASAISIRPYNDAAIDGGAAPKNLVSRAIVNESKNIAVHAAKLAADTGATPPQMIAAAVASVLANAHAIDNSATGEQAHNIAKEVALNVVEAANRGKAFTTRDKMEGANRSEQYSKGIDVACNYLGNVAGEAGRIAGVNTEQQRNIDNLVTKSMRMYSRSPDGLGLFKTQLKGAGRKGGSQINTSWIFGGGPIFDFVKDTFNQIPNLISGLSEDTPLPSEPNTWETVKNIATPILSEYVGPFASKVFHNLPFLIGPALRFVDWWNNKKDMTTGDYMSDIVATVGDLTALETFNKQKAKEDAAKNSFWAKHGDKVITGLQTSIPAAAIGVGSLFGPIGTGIGTGVGVVAPALLGLARPTPVTQGLADQMKLGQLKSLGEEMMLKQQKRQAKKDKEAYEARLKQDAATRYRIAAETEARQTYNVNPKSGVPQKRIHLSSEIAGAPTINRWDYVSPAAVAMGNNLGRLGQYTSQVYNAASVAEPPPSFDFVSTLDKVAKQKADAEKQKADAEKRAEETRKLRLENEKTEREAKATAETLKAAELANQKLALEIAAMEQRNRHTAADMQAVRQMRSRARWQNELNRLRL